jgi:glycosyltransferase involved in cell wall biosynthesis
MDQVSESGDVAVLIDSFQSLPYIDECLSSVRRQSYPVSQIVVSDGSTDGALDIIKAHASLDKRIQIVRGENHGQLNTIVAGLKLIRCNTVFFLDADDYYEEHHVATVMGRWSEFSHADLIYCRHRAVGDTQLVKMLLSRQDHENARWLGPIDLECPYDWGASTALAYSLPSHHAGGVNSCLSFRNEHLRHLPLLDMCRFFGSELKANADYIILLASALYGGRKIYVPDRTVNYRVHARSLTGRYAQGDAESDYWQRYYCALARNWLCSSQRFGPALFSILDKELAAVPLPSRGHRKLYKDAKRLHGM